MADMALERPTVDPDSTTQPVSATTPLGRAKLQLKELPSIAIDDVQFEDDVHLQKLYTYMNAVNVCDYLDDNLLGVIGSKVVEEYNVDEQSRADWKEKSEKAMKLAMQVAEKKVYPWPNASNVLYPLMTTASIQFAARAYPSIIASKGVVKGVVVGSDEGVPAMQLVAVPMQNPTTGNVVPVPTPKQVGWEVQPGAKLVLANKIGEHMSWQLLTEQPEWEEETDRLLHILPIVGCAFRKTFFDHSKGRNSALLVSPLNVCVNYSAKSIDTVPRITELFDLYPQEIKENELALVYREINYSPSTDGAAANDPDAPMHFLEQHRFLDLDEDGLAEPYIVTVHKDSQQVVRIVARYDEESIKVNSKTGKVMKIVPIQYYTKYDFLPNPEGGIYGVGFGQLLYPINAAVNTTLNMIIDAGHLAVTGGGFIGKGLSMHAGNVRFIPGEYKGVNVSGATVRDSIVPLNFPGPSPVLFQLLGMLVEAGKEIAAVKDVLTGEQKDANIPATTTLALIEQGLKVFTAIYKRIYRSLKSELHKLYVLNGKYLEEGTGYNIGSEWRTISRVDYQKGGGVEPISDPNMISDMQQLGRAQFLMGFMNDPLCNPITMRKRIFDAAKIEKADELLVTTPPIDPKHIETDEKLRISNNRTNAEAAKDLAQGILFLVQAHVALGETASFPQVEEQINEITGWMGSLHANAGTGLQQQPQPGGGPNPGAVPPVEATPGN